MWCRNTHRIANARSASAYAIRTVRDTTASELYPFDRAFSRTRAVGAGGEGFALRGERDVDDRDQHQGEQQRAGQAADHDGAERAFRLRAGIERQRERQHPGDHRGGRHDDRAEAFARGFADRGDAAETFVAAPVREIDQQDPVLRHQPDQQHRADQREQVQRLAGERERTQRADDRHGDREHDDERRAVAVVERDHQQVDQHDREQQRDRHPLHRRADLLLVAARGRCDGDGRRQLQRGEPAREVVLDVRELRAGREISAGVDDARPVDAHDHRRRRRLHERRDVADADDRAVGGADRDRFDRPERVLRALRVADQHVLEAVRPGELRRQVAAERRPDRGRRGADAGVERARSRLNSTFTCGASAIAGVTTSGMADAPQGDVGFNRERARSLDASIGTASTAIRAAFGGDLATQFTGPDGLKNVLVSYPQSAQDSLGAIEAIPIRAANGSIVRVGDIATLVQSPAPPMIVRINRASVVYAGADLAPGAKLSNVQHDFASRLAALQLPSSVTVAPASGGNEQQVSATVKGMTVALLLSIVLVYLLMVALYNSYRTPFIIMFAVPVAVVGALGSLALTGQTLNLFSLIGSVLLIGLVTKNGILLVDFANRRRNEGLGRIAAIRPRPSLRRRFAKSTSRIPFFVTSPISSTEPISENRFSVWPVSASEPSAPTTATGTANMMMNGVR